MHGQKPSVHKTMTKTAQWKTYSHCHLRLYHNVFTFSWITQENHLMMMKYGQKLKQSRQQGNDGVAGGERIHIKTARHWFENRLGWYCLPKVGRVFCSPEYKIRNHNKQLGLYLGSCPRNGVDRNHRDITHTWTSARVCVSFQSYAAAYWCWTCSSLC